MAIYNFVPTPNWEASTASLGVLRAFSIPPGTDYVNHYVIKTQFETVSRGQMRFDDKAPIAPLAWNDQLLTGQLAFQRLVELSKEGQARS